MGEDGVDISAKTPVYGICSRRIDLLCKSARADCGSGAIILVQEREYVIVKRLEIEVLDLLEHSLSLVEDIPGVSQLQFLQHLSAHYPATIIKGVCHLVPQLFQRRPDKIRKVQSRLTRIPVH
jgi:hypothetical protein